MKASLMTVIVIWGGFLVGGCASVSPDGKEWVETPEESVGEVSQALTGTHKLCSAIVPGNWRDTLIVGDSWTSSTCNNYRVSVTATTYQLGCVATSGYSNFGVSGGGLPAPNCGW